MVVQARRTGPKNGRAAPLHKVPTREFSEAPSHPLLYSGERLLGRAVALVAGLMLTVAGGGLCVTVVLLPLGIPIGLIGLFLVFAGVFGDAYGDRTRIYHRPPTTTGGKPG